LGRYFAVEFVTQFLTGAILAGVLMFTIGQPFEQRLLLVAFVALASITSIDLSYWNWWGFSNRYTLGVAVNRFISTMIAGGVVAALVIR
jgi:ABC-type thiamin/hydroxymethylpyrimidine transport system permease subunit